MLVLIFIICCFVETLRGAQVAPSVPEPDVALLGSPVPDQPRRTTSSIIYSCLATIFACVWKSLHPNINGPRDSGWTCFKRKVVTMLFALIAPEFVLLWALRQHSSAKDIAKQYNRKFARFGDVDKSFWEKLAGWFQPLTEETARRGAGREWTKTHGFFLQMGGFILVENEYPKEVLGYNRLVELLEKKAIDAPTVTERELQDRSKGDAVSKAIILLQMMWFIVQCIARAAQRLPLSELEVLTLAFAAVNGAIYAVWWKKPQGVDMPICIQIKTPCQCITNTLRGHTSVPYAGYNFRGMDDNTPLIPKQSWQWLRNQIRQDRQNYSFFVFFTFRLPYMIGAYYPLHIFAKLAGNIASNIPIDSAEDIRVPMFFVHVDPGSERDDRGISQLTSIIGMLFGAVHLLAWNSNFSSQWGLVLWRVSAVFLTVAPTVAFSLTLMADGSLEAHPTLLHALLWIFTFHYISARFTVIVVALLSICNPSAKVLIDVPWTSYLPHL